MSNLYDTSRWKTPVGCWLLAFAMLPAASDLKKSYSACDAPLYMSVKLGLISTATASPDPSAARADAIAEAADQPRLGW